MPEFQLENAGLTETVAEADPSALEFQALTAEAPVVNGEPTDPHALGISPIQCVCFQFIFTQTTVD